jgi:hypothetical protein
LTNDGRLAVGFGRMEVNQPFTGHSYSADEKDARQPDQDGHEDRHNF